MLQAFTGKHEVDSNGNPTGGLSESLGVWVKWQKDPLNIDGVGHESNGAFVETVLAIAMDRLDFYQKSKFKCKENEGAIASIAEALTHLYNRTVDRKKRGVEGTHTI